ncbi:MAG: hypothetical protein HY329_23570 [Chloroflexi bacterium]|nr:hypothetical protein [Chloroflexota bacterium]
MDSGQSNFTPKGIPVGALADLLAKVEPDHIVGVQDGNLCIWTADAQQYGVIDLATGELRQLVTTLLNNRARSGTW